MSLRDTWTPWLGPAADTVTDNQLEQLDAASAAIDARWPEPDLADTREAALAAAAQVILGDGSLESFGERYQAARAVERERHAELTGALIAGSTGARSGAGSESDLVARSGASRLTVRKAIGKT